MKKITASELRANIYRLLDRVAETGEPLDIEREGKLLRISAVAPPRKLDRLIERDVIVGDAKELVHMDWSDEWRP
jgi:antitoxin (DNA-binding transcriptional repressor) of toxin-antitoxin stability system